MFLISLVSFFVLERCNYIFLKRIFKDVSLKVSLFCLDHSVYMLTLF